MPKVGEQIEKGGRRLQPQQQKFLDNYIHKDMTQTGAARAAGYKSPNVRAVQLLNNPVVKERMEEMRQELESKYGVSVTKSVRDMQRLRDEAHRFAIGTHRARRKKAMVKSPLDGIPGVGPGRKKALLHAFGSARGVSRASVTDLEKVEGISRALAERIHANFRKA